jgi:hypothetical protein
MKDNSKNDLIDFLLSHNGVPVAAKGDVRLLASAVTQMEAALTRLPRTMHWSAQPLCVFKPVATHDKRD